MRLTHLAVALPRDIPHGARTVATGIFKQTVTGPVRVLSDRLEGDGQADRVHHGGPDKAVYAYGADHYDAWRRELGRDDLVPGQFGENLTIAGLDEGELCLGDRLAIGSARFVVTQPRVPCFKLGLRFGDAEMPKRFADSLRCGAYLRVLEPGSLEAGDAVQRVVRSHERVAIGPLFHAYLHPNEPAAQTLLARALTVPELSGDWRASIERRLARRPADDVSPDNGDIP
ncbi:MAG: MOSC domain-containing protein [Xanthomonadaceae bacterium]|nr:MOSC domain-containing protein [Xanthomonadaceae bacterium]MDE1964670.1 MOSC domain-containing protein [Xanthomonadaceae bacterium]